MATKFRHKAPQTGGRRAFSSQPLDPIKTNVSRRVAGRPPRAVPREALTIRLEPEIAEKFKAICKSNRTSQSQQLSLMVMAALDIP